MARYLYSELSRLISARSNRALVMNGHKPGDGANAEKWFNRHEETIEKLVKSHMPSGSGFDSGTKIDLEASHAEKLVFTTSFHHMDEGMYSGWTEHTVTVTPSLSEDFHLRVSGRNRNDIKDYIFEAFSYSLKTDVEYDLLQGVPTFEALDIAVKFEWIDQSRQRWFVTVAGVEVYTPEQTTNYSGTPYERCKAFAVGYWDLHKFDGVKG